jgi:aminodeoxyfutalosine deaminase
VALNRGRESARQQQDVELAWIYDISGVVGVPSGVRAIEWAERYLPSGSVGFGIDGPKADMPRSDFTRVFERARDLGPHSVPHAGEVSGPASIRQSIDHLKAERVGHGIAAAQDAALMAERVDRDIVLELCPTSNVRTRAVESLDAHPFLALTGAGVCETVNSDDPGLFDTDVNREYVIAHEVFGLEPEGLVELARESVHASFAPHGVRERILEEIDAYASASIAGRETGRV